MTKKDWYGEIRKIVETSEVVEDEIKNGALEFIDSQVQALEAKAIKAQADAEKKKAEGDELREAVFKVLTNELQTIEQITDQVAAAVEDVEVSKAKVTARLTQLVKLEKVGKAMVKTEDGRRVTAYKIVEETEE